VFPTTGEGTPTEVVLQQHDQRRSSERLKCYELTRKKRFKYGQQFAEREIHEGDVMANLFMSGFQPYICPVLMIMLFDGANIVSPEGIGHHRKMVDRMYMHVGVCFVVLFLSVPFCAKLMTDVFRCIAIMAR
jgi:hypothetical protein